MGPCGGAGGDRGPRGARWLYGRLCGFSLSQPLHDFRVSPAHGLSVWCAQPDWPRKLVLPNSAVNGGLAETDRAREFVKSENSVFLLHEDGESPITT